MKIHHGILAMAAMATFGLAGMGYAADMSDDQTNRMDKQQQQGIQKESELGLKGKTGDGKSDTMNEDRSPVGAGSVGEDTKGGAGPSGTKGLPSTKAPGYEGADKERGRAPTAGGH